MPTIIVIVISIVWMILLVQYMYFKNRQIKTKTIMTNKKLFKKLVEKYSQLMKKEWGNVETPQRIMISPNLEDVEKWLDNNCNNGYHSRWTNFGNSLYEYCQDIVEEYNNILCNK